MKNMFFPSNSSWGFVVVVHLYFCVPLVFLLKNKLAAGFYVKFLLKCFVNACNATLINK